MPRFCCPAVLMLLMSLPVAAQDAPRTVVFPPDAGYVDVRRDCGAVGDGVADDTAALRKALEGDNGFVYFPAGVYLVRDTVGGGKFKRRILQGESRDRVVIRLADHAPGFDDPDRPRPVVSLYDRFMDPASSNGQAFRNSVFDLTIDVGAGNRGAVALHYFNNNQGSVQNVTLRSSDPDGAGKAGFALVTNWPGPAMVRNLRVEGFDYGVWSTIGQYSMAFEDLHLSSQRVAGIHNRRQMLSIHRLRSDNRAPAVRSQGGLLVLVDARLDGGGGEPAIEAEGAVYLRDIRASGYGVTLLHTEGTARTELREPHLREWASRPAVDAAGAPRAAPLTLALPIEDVPELPYDPPEQWANVQDFGARPAAGANQRDPPDATAGVQAAIDSGRGTVYFPRGVYVLNDTIRVRGNVRRIIGMESQIRSGAGFEGADKPVWRIEDGASPVVVLERWEAGYGNRARTAIDLASTRTLVLRALLPGGGFRNSVPGGRLFIDDVCQGDWVFDRLQVWARQLNPENAGTKVHNRGGTLWCLNLKTEKGGASLLSTDGARSEILGGYIYYNRGTDGATPVINDRSAVSFLALLNIHGGAQKGQVMVREQSDAGTREATVWPFLYTGDATGSAPSTDAAPGATRPDAAAP